MPVIYWELFLSILQLQSLIRMTVAWCWYWTWNDMFIFFTKAHKGLSSLVRSQCLRSSWARICPQLTPVTESIAPAVHPTTCEAAASASSQALERDQSCRESADMHGTSQWSKLPRMPVDWSLFGELQLELQMNPGISARRANLNFSQTGTQSLLRKGSFRCLLIAGHKVRGCKAEL